MRTKMSSFLCSEIQVCLLSCLDVKHHYNLKTTWSMDATSSNFIGHIQTCLSHQSQRMLTGCFFFLLCRVDGTEVSSSELLGWFGLRESLMVQEGEVVLLCQWGLYTVWEPRTWTNSVVLNVFTFSAAIFFLSFFLPFRRKKTFPEHRHISSNNNNS